jgi:2-polyprenyl-6-methoxyphenol hydroxylase-like FAD-dependent oxidoreductase
MNDPRGTAYDVLIVGARVAGASLALLLGQRGHRVLLVDRDRFPSDTLSTHFMGVLAVPLLARLGVLADVEAAGFRRVTRARTWVEDCLFEGPIGPGGAYALAPRRDVLDALLIDRAVATGHVTFRARTRALGLVEEGGRVAGAMLAAADGTRAEARARVVGGADGKHSAVAAWVGAEAYHAEPILRPAYYGYYRGLAPLPEPALEIFFGDERMGLIFPMRPGEDCLALAPRPGDFDAFRADPRGAFEAHYRALPGMAARLDGATLEGKIRGTRGVENFFRRPYGPGWALTGDAGHLKDPSTGTGMGDALSQSFWLTDALDAALRGADWDTTLADFQRRRDEALLPGYRATLAFTRQPDAPPEAVAWTRAALAAPPFVRLLATGMGAALPAAFDPEVLPRVAQLARAFGGTGM